MYSQLKKKIFVCVYVQIPSVHCSCYYCDRILFWPWSCLHPCGTIGLYCLFFFICSLFRSRLITLFIPSCVFVSLCTLCLVVYKSYCAFGHFSLALFCILVPSFHFSLVFLFIDHGLSLFVFVYLFSNPWMY